MRWLPWHRIRRASLMEYSLANVKAKLVSGNHWKITIGPEEPLTYDFYGTEDQLKEEVRKRDEEVQQVRRQAVRAMRARQALQRLHEEGRHTGSSLSDCPRCRRFLRRTGEML